MESWKIGVQSINRTCYCADRATVIFADGSSVAEELEVTAAVVGGTGVRLDSGDTDDRPLFAGQPIETFKERLQTS